MPVSGDWERWTGRCEHGERRTTVRHPRPMRAAATGRSPEPDAWPGGAEGARWRRFQPPRGSGGRASIAGGWPPPPG
eukprot:9719265-Alexandrium_andersonii.AAC.1